jgi:hypothetical protein
MNKPLPKPAPSTDGITWNNLSRRLACHINWLHRTAPETSNSRARIERWRRQLDLAATGQPGNGRRRS